MAGVAVASANSMEITQRGSCNSSMVMWVMMIWWWSWTWRFRGRANNKYTNNRFSSQLVIICLRLGKHWSKMAWILINKMNHLHLSKLYRTGERFKMLSKRITRVRSHHVTSRTWKWFLTKNTTITSGKHSNNRLCLTCSSWWTKKRQRKKRRIKRKNRKIEEKAKANKKKNPSSSSCLKLSQWRKKLLRLLQNENFNQKSLH